MANVLIVGAKDKFIQAMTFNTQSIQAFYGEIDLAWDSNNNNVKAGNHSATALLAIRVNINIIYITLF